MPYVNAQGELKLIDRLVEFDNGVWVLDYKLGDSEDAARYQAQMQDKLRCNRCIQKNGAMRVGVCGWGFKRNKIIRRMG